MKIKSVYLLITITLLFSLSLSGAGLSQESPSPTPSSQIKKGTIIVNFTDFRNDKGQVHASLSNSSSGFSINFKKAVMDKRAKIVNGKSQIVFKDVPYGQYAVLAYHDEDDNKKLNLAWYGKPVEGMGASNNTKGRPNFDKAKFNFQEEKLEIEVKIRYF